MFIRYLFCDKINWQKQLKSKMANSGSQFQGKQSPGMILAHNSRGLSAEMILAHNSRVQPLMAVGTCGSSWSHCFAVRKPTEMNAGAQMVLDQSSS